MLDIIPKWNYNKIKFCFGIKKGEKYMAETKVFRLLNGVTSENLCSGRFFKGY